MFEAFSQEENKITPEYQGSGLGLAIVKQLADMMGASITVKSKLGEGTEFAIRFAFQTVDDSAAIAPKPEPLSLGELKGKRILLAEDHPLNAMIAAKLLEKEGMTVMQASNGKEAIDKFNSLGEHCFDAILMDIRMPIMNGLDATRAIRALDRSDAKTVPIIAMTANAFDSDVHESLAAGMNAHLSKPIDPNKLYETLAQFIRER